jgi:hypothetical protein
MRARGKGGDLSTFTLASGDVLTERRRILLDQDREDFIAERIAIMVEEGGLTADAAGYLARARADERRLRLLAAAVRRAP